MNNKRLLISLKFFAILNVCVSIAFYFFVKYSDEMYKCEVEYFNKYFSVQAVQNIIKYKNDYSLLSTNQLKILNKDTFKLSLEDCGTEIDIVDGFPNYNDPLMYQFELESFVEYKNKYILFSILCLFLIILFPKWYVWVKQKED